jgi:NIMA (never in mitosis gene a)-related kinase
MPLLFDDVPGGEYATLKKLGKGSYGIVYLVRNKRSGSTCCLKKMSLKAMGEQERERALQEAQLLSRLNHPNIVAYVDSFVSRSKLYLFMQYCEGGDLDGRLVKMKAAGEIVSEAQVLDWASQMAFALSYLHDRKVLHRDLKAANVFLTGSGVVKLGDFGVSRVLSQTAELASTFVGTPYYLSPELLGNQLYDAASDVWAYGCIVYEMCTYAHPFEAADFPSLAARIMNAEPPSIPLENYSASLAQLVAGTLVKNPLKRLGLRKVLEAPIVRARMARFVEEFVAPPPPEPAHAAARGGAGRASKAAPTSKATPAPVATPVSAATPAERAAGKPSAGAAMAPPPPRVATPAPPDSPPLRPHASSANLRAAASRPSTAAAASDATDEAAMSRERAILAEIEAEKRRLQERMAALEREQQRFSAQQQQSSSLRAFQKLLEGGDGGMAIGGGAELATPLVPCHADGMFHSMLAEATMNHARELDSTREREEWPLPGEPGWRGSGCARNAADATAQPTGSAWAQPPPTHAHDAVSTRAEPSGTTASSELERTLSRPSSPMSAADDAADDGGWRAEYAAEARIVALDPAMLAGAAHAKPVALDATLDASQLGAALAATLQAVGAVSHSVVFPYPPGPPAALTVGAPAEPPTRTLSEWAACYVPSEDGRGIRREPLLRSLSLSKQHSRSSREGEASAGSPTRSHSRSPRCVRAQPSAAQDEPVEEQYESDFEAYSSQFDEDDDDEEDILDAVQFAGTQGHLEKELMDLQLQSARAVAEQQSLELLAQTRQVYQQFVRDGGVPVDPL